MPDHQPRQIVLQDVAHFKRVFDEAATNGTADKLALRWLMLTELCARYLAEPQPEGITREAFIWPDYHHPNSFYFSIMEGAEQGTDRRLVLGGGLVFHTDDRTWGIHT